MSHTLSGLDWEFLGEQRCDPVGEISHHVSDQMWRWIQCEVLEPGCFELLNRCRDLSCSAGESGHPHDLVGEDLSLARQQVRQVPSVDLLVSTILRDGESGQHPVIYVETISNRP